MRGAALKVLLVMGGLFAGIILSELLLRAIGFYYDPVDEFSIPIYKRDAELGWWHTPEVTSEYVGEGQSRVTINRYGLRDREHSLVKPPHCLRIAVLGDSLLCCR